MHSKLLLGAALVATALLYWTGLSGPFLFDDIPNLEPVQRWLAGTESWKGVFDTQPGGFGRPLAMASFMLSATLGGLDPYWFKLGNLIVHLVCGLLGWLVLRRALAGDPVFAPRADLVAGLIATLWLVHPLHASTVLYVVQRMTQLSTLFVLAAIWVYLVGRKQLQEGRLSWALPNLFGLFPVLVFAGFLAKENAAVAPALCLVLELAYFNHKDRPRRALAVFYALFLAIPVLAGLALLWLDPNTLMGGYAIREFSWDQRLLTQARVLMHYIGTLIFPRAPLLGLFTDDFQASSGWLSPPGTLFAVLSLAGISAVAIALRRRAPSLFAGWFFFLVAHGVESTILPLELYFEHRNYLPAFGLLLAVFGLASLIPKDLPTNVISMPRLGIFAAGAFALVFAFATLSVAHVWQHEDTIITQGLKAHPDSLRANRAAAMNALSSGRYAEGVDVLDRFATSDQPRHRLIARIDKVALACARHAPALPVDLEMAADDAQPKITLSELYALEQLARFSEQGNCGEVSNGMIAHTIARIVDAASAQPDHLRPKWRLRHVAAQQYARAGRWDLALSQAKLAWQPNADPVVGGLLIRIYAHNNMHADAERTLAEVEKRVPGDDVEGQAALAQLRELIGKH